MMSDLSLRETSECHKATHVTIAFELAATLT